MRPLDIEALEQFASCTPRRPCRQGLWRYPTHQPKILSVNQPNFQFLSENLSCFIVTTSSSLSWYYCGARKALITFMVRVKGAVLKHLLGTPSLNPSFLPLQLYSFSAITCGITSIIMFRPLRHWGRGALLPNNSTRLYIEVLYSAFYNNFSIEFTKSRV